jgi:hypothetical protein
MKDRSLKLLKPSLPLFAMGSFTAVMLVLTAVGVARNYSPVPFWDMWDGYLNFFLSVGDGDMTAWWRQQNEHRIVLAHLLFWADLRWFGGASWFLLLANYALAGAAALLFWRMLRARLAVQPRSVPETMMGLFLVALLFSWMQQENFTWAFQSQFFLAQLLPLWALYCLHLSLAGPARTGWFALACLGGVGAAGSMANGILALPLLLGYALLTRQGWRRCAVLALLAVVTLVVYFHNYQQSPGHIPFLTVVHDSALPLLTYMLQYLGSPFYFLTGSSGAGKVLALLGGVLLVVACLHQAVRWYRGRGDTLLLALLFFLAYIGATATGTASGRLHVGSGEAFSSRYTTPALMAWAAVLLLYAPALLAAARASRRRATQLTLLLLLVAVPMLALQASALRSRAELGFEKNIAALALELGIADQPQVGHVFPSALAILPIVERARAQQLSVFGMAPWRGLHASMGQPAAPSAPAALPPCQGSLDEVAPVEGDANYLRVAGWLRNPDGATVPARVRFIDVDGKLAGIALTGRIRPDVAAAVGKGALHAGFQGYVLASEAGAALSLQADVASGACALPVQIPAPLVLLTSMAPVPAGALSVTAVLPGNTWLGGDYERVPLPGMRVYGSFVHADTDTGAISLRVKRGDRLFYRSGPDGGRQIMALPGSGLADIRLPVRSNWAQLEFSGAALPEGEFTVTFTDAGDSWGEWSAIAVRE